MSDVEGIVERLRKGCVYSGGDRWEPSVLLEHATEGLMDEAADEIERLLSELQSRDATISRLADAIADLTAAMANTDRTGERVTAALAAAEARAQKAEAALGEAHALLDKFGQARTEGDGPDEEALTLSGRILNLESDRKASQAALGEAVKVMEELASDEFSGPPGISLYAAAANELTRRQRFARGK